MSAKHQGRIPALIRRLSLSFHAIAIAVIGPVMFAAASVMLMPSVSIATGPMALDQPQAPKAEYNDGAGKLEKLGKQLRAAIDDTYHSLANTHTLQLQNNISSVAEAYIPVGTSFVDAEAILHSAGAKIEYGCKGAMCASMKLNSSWFTTVEVRINLYPDLPGDPHSAIGKVGAIILYNSL